jgi:PadR family transcriptional regulator, regulatory protein AphA
MNVRTICLAILAHGEATGYDLKKSWQEGPFAYLGGASYGSIYPALAKLQQDGLIKSREEIQPGKPARKIYALTGAGRAAFVAEMSGTPEPDEFRSHFGVIALCVPFLERSVVSRVIEERLRQQRENIAMLEKAQKKGTAVGWLLDWGLTQYKNEVAFIEASRSELEALAGTGKCGQPMPHCPAEAGE